MERQLSGAGVKVSSVTREMKYSPKVSLAVLYGICERLSKGLSGIKEGSR